ncbi:hypothetical protein Zmor_012124 [Zophobas morio]|uniref:Asp23/Gls24 family envelope stress response protein n=1 Tax=Zophobas morio TaxID=2755281 RepID=A0AA38HGD2_9CUCU|nr:hypothetical protein Zmor_012124 [Zophobas morio]
MPELFQEKAFEVIEEAVEAVPGVVSFANFKAKSHDSIKTDRLDNAIEVQSSDKNYKFKIHVALMNGINIKEVLEEIQNRVSDGLEKLGGQNQSYIIDVVVDDLVVL